MLPQSLPAEKSKILDDTAPIRVKNEALHMPPRGQV